VIPPVTGGTVYDQTARRLAREHYATQAALAGTTAAQALRAWQQVDPDDPERSWLQQLGRRVHTLITSAQRLSAQRSVAYVRRVLGVYPDPPRPVAEVVTSRLVDVASDGRPLVTLLLQPARTATQARRAGASREQAAGLGERQLEAIVRTQVADAGRVAASVETVATPTVGHVRVVNLPACSRCIVLAGRWYRSTEGFLRHPNCDCTMQPATQEQAAGLTLDPRELFEQMPVDERRRVFGEAGAQAVADGADIGRVVNARRRGAMYTASVGGREVLATREATTRRGGVRRRIRLMPEAIYQLAGGDRDEVLRLLRVNGYLT
jgi:hypothetical protein